MRRQSADAPASAPNAALRQRAHLASSQVAERTAYSTLWQPPAPGGMSSVAGSDRGINRYERHLEFASLARTAAREAASATGSEWACSPIQGNSPSPVHTFV